MTKPISHIKEYLYRGDSEPEKMDPMALMCEEFFFEDGRTKSKWDQNGMTLCEYDAEDRLCEQSVHGSLGVKISRYEYNPDGDLFHIKTTREHPERYNDDHYCICTGGSIVGAEYYDSGEIEEEWITWDVSELLREHERVTRDWEGNEDRSYKEVEHDDHGRVVEERIYDGKKSLLLKTRYLYSESGRLQEEETLAYFSEDDEEGKLYSKILYDEKERVINALGPKGEKITYQYTEDQYGNWIRRRFVCEEDSGITEGINIREIEYY